MPSITTVAEIGSIIRADRKARGMTIDQFAALAGIGRRWLFEVEHGKPTIRAGSLLELLTQSGYTITISQDN